MKIYQLTIVTENQKSIEKAKVLADLIKDALNASSDFSIFKYEKFSDSYKIQLNGGIQNDLNSVQESIIIANKLCSPWIVYYQEEVNEISLIFNKSDSSIFQKQQFNVLKWANLEIESE